MEAVVLVPELEVGKNDTHSVTYLLDILLSSNPLFHVRPQCRHNAAKNKPDFDITTFTCGGEYVVDLL